MANREPKTLRGQIRKELTDDGRKSLGTAVAEELLEKKKRLLEEVI